MQIPSYLMLSRHNVYYFRWPVPKALHPHGKYTHLKVSLRTREPHTAVQLSRSLAFVACRLLNEVVVNGLENNMRYDDIRALLKTHFSELLEERKSSIAETGRLSVTARATLQSSLTIASSAELFHVPNYDEAPPVDRLIALYGLSASPGTKTYQTLSDELRRSYSGYCQEVLDFDLSLETYDFSTHENNSEPVMDALVETVILKELVDAYISECTQGGNWTDKTERENRSTFKLLIDVLGAETSCMAIDVAAARKVKELLQQLPKNMKNNPRTRDLSLVDAIALPDVERIHVKTINKHLAAYISLFKWAEKNGHVSKNVFAGLKIKQKTSSGDQPRVAFSIEQSSAIMNAITRNEHGLIKKPYQKWGPLISLFSGTRLNEIAQLRLEDVREQDSVWCFDINEDAEDKRLKTPSAARLIPVHSKLIELGFIDYVKGLKLRRSGRLFDELGYSKGSGYGRNLSRWFNGPFLKALGMDNQSLVFHSFRHAMITNLLQTGVAEPLIKAIVGHAREGVTQTVYFGQGYTVAQKKEALELLPW